MQGIVNGPVVAFVRVCFGPETMTLKIERISGKRRTRIRLSGAFRSEHLDQVKAEVERGGPLVDLDLQELDLVDVEGVRFLNACEAEEANTLDIHEIQLLQIQIY